MDPNYPFGDPEGARSDIDESFVRFEGSQWGGLAMQPDDRMVRVIVGSKGSGKTVFLRRLHAHALTESGQSGSIFTDRTIPTDPPDTNLIIRFCEMERSPQLTEAWSKAWQRAILRSVTSYLVHVPELAKRIPNAKRRTFQTYKRLVGAWKTPRSVYDQLTEILQSYNRQHALRAYLNDPQWGDVEYELADALRVAPPIFLYLDYLDEKFEAAPMHWHRCQIGLFDRVMTTLRDQALGGRLHVIIAVRDVVYASILRSEHRGRYVGQPHIRLLNWDRQAIRYFLDRKIATLESSHLLKPDAPSPLARWLGRESVWNRKREIREDGYDYLLRHSRLLPRDIVTLGNALSRHVVDSRIKASAEIDEAEMRTIVRQAASGFGEEQLTICASHLAALCLPSGAARDGYADFYVAHADYQLSMAEKLKEVLRDGAGKDRLTAAELEGLRRCGQERIDRALDLPSVLWQNGLLGYVVSSERGPKDVFFPISGELGFALPPGHGEYVFHSCLIDAVGLKAVGVRPVYPDM